MVVDTLESADRTLDWSPSGTGLDLELVVCLRIPFLDTGLRSDNLDEGESDTFEEEEAMIYG